MNAEIRGSTAILEEIPQAKKKKKVCYQIIKRVADIFGSVLALAIAGPVILMIAAAIYIDDPHGSPFFCQPRVGKDGKEFKLWKLRSMVCGAEDMLEDLQDQNEMDGPAFKIEDDPRITRIGRFIRKCSIDELPQFWNVLKGDMSIVGPRPPLPREVAEYTAYHSQRLTVKPGITCIWQIQPKRNDLSFDEWVKLDIDYINRCCIWLDVKLMLQTAGAMFRGEGR